MFNVHHRPDSDKRNPQPGPELRPFDPCGDDPDDFDTPLELYDPRGNPDFEPSPDPVACAACALTISAPRGVRPAAEGYTVYAVAEEPDGAGGFDVVSGQALTHKYENFLTARSLAILHADNQAAIEIAATAVVVNDHRGQECCRIPLAAAA